MKKLKNVKTSVKIETTRHIIKSEGEGLGSDRFGLEIQ